MIKEQIVKDLVKKEVKNERQAKEMNDNDWEETMKLKEDVRQKPIKDD